MLIYHEDEAPVTFTRFNNFKVITTRKNMTCAAAPDSFCDTAAHCATLIASSTSDWTVLEKSEDREYLVDAVEDLWMKVLTKAGEMCGGYLPVMGMGKVELTTEIEGVKVGEKFPVQEEDIERVESVTTLASKI